MVSLAMHLIEPASSDFIKLTAFRGANTGAGQDLTGLAAAVQLRHRVAFTFRVASIAAMRRSLKP